MRSISICSNWAKFKFNIKVNFWSSQGQFNSNLNRQYWDWTILTEFFSGKVDILKNWHFLNKFSGKMGVQSLGNFRAWIIKRKNWQGRHQKCTGKNSYATKWPKVIHFFILAVCDWTIENWKIWWSKKFKIRNRTKSVFRCEPRWWSSLVERNYW